MIYGKMPTYYIYGGIVFTPLTLNLLVDLLGDNWSERAPPAFQEYYFNGMPTKDRQEIIVILKVLPDEINVGYHNGSGLVVTEVNGIKISSMSDLVNTIENNSGEYTVVKIADGAIGVIDRQKATKAEQQILGKFGITSSRSRDLMK
jgi:S1-C subfamily serine protease